MDLREVGEVARDEVAPRVFDARKQPGGLPCDRGVPREVLGDARVDDCLSEERVDATIELWESDEGPVWTATGEAIAGTTLALGRLRLDMAFFRWRMNGREGVGRYDILQRFLED